MEAVVVGAIAVGVVCGLVGACIADQKQAGVLGFLLGLLLGPFGLLLCFFLDSRPRCPHCSERLHLDANICPNCRSEVFWCSGHSYRSKEQVEEAKARERARRLASEECSQRQREEMRKLREAQEELWCARVEVARKMCVKWFGALKVRASSLNGKRKRSEDSLMEAVRRVSGCKSEKDLYWNRVVVTTYVALFVITVMIFSCSPVSQFYGWLSGVDEGDQLLNAEVVISGGADKVEEESDTPTRGKSADSVATDAIEGVMEVVQHEIAKSEHSDNESSGKKGPAQESYFQDVNRFGYTELASAKEWRESQLNLVQNQFRKWLEDASEKSILAGDYSEAGRIQVELNSFVEKRKHVDNRFVWVYANGYFQVLHDGRWFECELLC